MGRLAANPLALILATLLALSTAGCGYRFIDSSELTDARVSIGSVEDRSREPIFGAMVRARLAERSIGRSDVKTVSRSDSTAPRLDVKLNTLTETARAYREDGYPREYLLKVSGDATLTTSDGVVVWTQANISVRREFGSGTDVNITRANKDRALKLLADDLAGEILRRVAVGRWEAGK